jgi:poly-beta-1,6-N-acetyl-D-glucosamine synthase
MSRPDRYAVLTPARNEAARLPRLARALAAQTVPPSLWLIIENGSADDTLEVATALERTYSFAHVLRMAAPASRPVRGAPIVRAIHAGLERAALDVDIVMKIDADITFEPGYAERLLTEFADDPSLGIASGSCFEEHEGQWLQQHMTADMVWCAARAYRVACLSDVTPFEERFGWDGIDVAKARLRGWRTHTFTDLPFQHHRTEGERDGTPSASWINQGRGCYFLGYRPTYVVLRAIGRARREPRALSMIWGYVSEALNRGQRYQDREVVAYLRQAQRARHIFQRARESVGLGRS